MQLHYFRVLETEPGGKYSVAVTADVVTLIIRSVLFFRIDRQGNTG